MNIKIVQVNNSVCNDSLEKFNSDYIYNMLKDTSPKKYQVSYKIHPTINTGQIIDDTRGQRNSTGQSGNERPNTDK
jgi:hypothetical protein